MGERRKQRRNCRPPSIAESEVSDRFVQTETYICSELREITKKTETKSYYKDKMGRNKKLQQKQQKREMQENRGCRMNSAGAVNSVAGTKFCNAPFFFTFCFSFLLGSDLQ